MAALTLSQQKVMTKGLALARLLTEQYAPLARELNVIWDASGGLASTITQADIDAVPAFQGLTVQNFVDAFEVVTGTVLNDVNNGLSQLAVVASQPGLPAVNLTGQF
jgi:hypothetical protein